MNRFIVTALEGALLAACAAGPTATPVASTSPIVGAVSIHSAGPGSAFLPYAQGLARHLSATLGIDSRAVESTGSIENLRRVNAVPTASDSTQIGTVFLGSAHEAWTGSGSWTKGERLTDIRALFPMYETSFQIAALQTSNLRTLVDLQGKRVGVGPRGGPAESFFVGLTEAVGMQTTLVTGNPSELVQALVEGRIDALWQGAIVPIPSIKAVTEQAPAVVFGLTEGELAAMLKRFPYLARAEVAAGTYRGQAIAVRSVAAWNFVIAHRDLSDADAYRITRAALTSTDPAAAIHPWAAATRAANARQNRVIPFHPGALRHYREIGLQP